MFMYKYNFYCQFLNFYKRVIYVSDKWQAIWNDAEFNIFEVDPIVKQQIVLFVIMFHFNNVSFVHNIKLNTNSMVTEWPPIGKIAAHSAYDMFHGIST